MKAIILTTMLALSLQTFAADKITPERSDEIARFAYSLSETEKQAVLTSTPMVGIRDKVVPWLGWGNIKPSIMTSDRGYGYHRIWSYKRKGIIYEIYSEHGYVYKVETYQ